jgi:hypothetical protein
MFAEERFSRAENEFAEKIFQYHFEKFKYF